LPVLVVGLLPPSKNSNAIIIIIIIFNGVLVFHITGFERMCDEPIISYMELE